MRALTHSLRGRSWLVVLALFAVSCSTASSPAPTPDRPSKSPITEAEINAAQKAWCDGLVQIAKVNRDGGDYKTEANKFVDKMYDFDGSGKVFFRPTLAFAPHAFRTDKAGTLSYFIGGNPAFPDGEGFARGPWVAAEYSNDLGGGVNGIQIHDDIGLAMGTVSLTDCQGKKTVVDKVFAFRKDPVKGVRLIIHMSAKSNAPPPLPTPTPIPCPK
jgi:hypothetical protein